MVDLQSELESLAREFAARVAGAVKRAALEAVAEALRGDARAVELAPVENDGPPEPQTDDDDLLAPDPDLAGLPLESWPERRPPPVADRVLFFVRAKPGKRAQDICAALGLGKDDVKKAVASLVAEGRIVKDGGRNWTKYRPA